VYLYSDIDIWFLSLQWWLHNVLVIDCGHGGVLQCGVTRNTTRVKTELRAMKFHVIRTRAIVYHSSPAETANQVSIHHWYIDDMSHVAVFWLLTWLAKLMFTCIKPCDSVIIAILKCCLKFMMQIWNCLEVCCIPPTVFTSYFPTVYLCQ